MTDTKPTSTTWQSGKHRGGFSLSILGQYSKAAEILAKAEGIPKSEVVARALHAYQIRTVEPDGTRRAGWVIGMKRDSPLSVRSETFERAVAIAAAEQISKGVAVERALLAYMENHPNGAGARALKAVKKVLIYTKKSGYTPRKGGRAWATMVQAWGPAPHRPRPCFKWRRGQGPLAEREAAQGTAYQCLWCDAYTKTGAEVLEHAHDCPTQKPLSS